MRKSVVGAAALVYSLAVTIPVSHATSYISPPLVHPNSAVSFAPASVCKLTSTLIQGESLAYQRPTGVVPSVGTRRAVVLLADFTDVPFNAKQLTEWRDSQIPTFTKYISSDSYSKLTYTIDINPTVFHIPHDSLFYNLDTPDGTTPRSNANFVGLMRDAATAADPTVDFSQYEFFNVVLPDTRNIGINGSAGVDTSQVLDGRRFYRATFSSIHEYVDNPQKSIWFLHESGHLMGLLHAFTPGQNVPIWGVMSSGTSNEPDFMGWERYILRWISDSENRCIDSAFKGRYAINLAPLSTMNSAIKLITVRTSPHNAIVVEYRTPTTLSHITKSQSGVIAYTVDTNVPGNAGAMKLLYKSGNKQPAQLGTLQAGESVSSGNVVVTDLGNGSSNASVEIIVK